MSHLRTKGVALVLGLVGAGLTLVALSATWATLGAGSTPGAQLAGRQAAPAALALALASSAGLGVLLLLGRVGRRVVGALLVGLGLGTAMTALDGLRGIEDGSALPREWSGALPAVASTPIWGWLAVSGGLAIAASGVLALLFGGTWPAPGRRYAASGGSVGSDLWRAIDQGVDPTLDD